MNKWTIFDLLQPACLACGLPGARGALLCPGCTADLPWLGRVCHRCAGSLDTGAGGQDEDAGPGGSPGCVSPLPCPACLREPPPVRRTLAALAYDFPVDRLVQQLKFGGRLPVGRALGDCLAACVPAAYAGDVLPEVLVPIPLGRRRARQRGFNQARCIAARVGKQLRMPVDAHCLARSRETAPQSEQDLATRRRNLAGAFRAVGQRHAHVALVDDVCTTGSTLFAAAIALREAGVARVDAWVVARKL